MKLYVGNLCHTMTEINLGDLFSLHGSVLKVRIIRDHFTRQSKCFGYVQMAEKEEGLGAITALHGATVNGRSIVVREARPRDERFGLPW